jgi:hypothetical protein
MNGLPCQDAELKVEKYGRKTLEKFGCEKYTMAKITRINTVIVTVKVSSLLTFIACACLSTLKQSYEADPAIPNCRIMPSREHPQSNEPRTIVECDIYHTKFYGNEREAEKSEHVKISLKSKTFRAQFIALP